MYYLGKIAPTRPNHDSRVHPAIHWTGCKAVDGNPASDKKAAAVQRLVQHMQAWSHHYQLYLGGQRRRPAVGGVLLYLPWGRGEGD